MLTDLPAPTRPAPENEPVDGGSDAPTRGKYSRRFRSRSAQFGRTGVFGSTTRVPVIARIRHRRSLLGPARCADRCDASLSVQLDALRLRLVPPLRANAYPLSRRFAPTAHRLRSASTCGRVSAADHAQEDAIPAHEMMVERGADMGGHKAGYRDADQRVKEEKSVGECAVLRPDRRQLEPPEHDHRRPIC